MNNASTFNCNINNIINYNLYMIIKSLYLANQISFIPTNILEIIKIKKFISLF